MNLNCLRMACAAVLLGATTAWAQPLLPADKAMDILRGSSPEPPASEEPALRRALQNVQARNDPGDRTGALPLMRTVLASNLLAQASFVEAEALAREALAAADAASVKYLATLQLAAILTETGRFPEAEVLLLQSLDGQPDMVEPNSSNALLLAALARNHLAAGEDLRAEQVLSRALPMLEQQGSALDLETRRAQMDTFRLLVRKGGHGAVAVAGFGIYRYTAPPEQTLTLVDREALQATAEFYDLYVLDRAEALWRRLVASQAQQLDPGHPLVARARHGLARNLLMQGKDGDAAPLARQALTARVSRLPARHPDIADSLDLLASVLAVQGRNAEAQSLWRRGLDLLPATPSILRAQLLLRLGNHLVSVGHADEALPMLSEALQALAHQKMRPLPLFIEGLLAATNAQLRSGQCLHPVLLDSLEKVVPLAQRHANFFPGYLEARAFQELARGLACAGQMQKAKQAFDMAFIALLGRVMASDSSETQTLSAHAAYSLSGSEETLDDAARWALQAAGYARAWRRQAGGDASRHRAMSELFQSQLQVAWQQLKLRADGSGPWRQQVAPGAFAGAYRNEGFMAAQDVELSSAARALAQTAARLAAGSTAQSVLVRRKQDLDARAQTLDREVISANARGDTADAQQMKIALERVAAELALVDAEVTRDYPEYRALVEPQTVSIIDLQKRLRPGEGVLLIVPSGNDIHVFAVSPTADTWHRATGAALSTSRLINRLRCQVDPANCGTSAEGSRGASLVGATASRPAATRFDAALAHRIYRELVAPVESALAGVQRLYVTATGPIATLPLAMLPTDADGTQWFADRYVLVSLPAVASLRAFRSADSPSERSTRPTLVGLGDPVLAGPAGGSRGTVPPARWFSSGVDGAARVDPAQVRALQPLPGTRRELTAMANLFPAQQTLVKLGTEATESLVKSEAKLGSADVLVFATHGLLPRELGGLEEPGLVLTPPSDATVVDDGVLTASEVAQLSLRAELVILSACNTAAGDSVDGGDTLSGLARAFLYAGARAVLASHWRVQDDVTAVLTVQTLQARRDNPALSQAEALQRAMRAVRTGRGVDGQRLTQWQPDWALPTAWAPFVLVATDQ